MNIKTADQNILYELSLNARQPSSMIGKRIHMSQQLVDYRIKRLENKGIILGYRSYIDFTKIGFSIIKSYFKFQNLTEDLEKDIIEYLVKHPNCNWVASCSGNWDLFIVLFCKNIIDFNKMLNDIFIKFSYYIANSIFGSWNKFENDILFKDRL